MSYKVIQWATDNVGKHAIPARVEAGYRFISTVHLLNVQGRGVLG